MRRIFRTILLLAVFLGGYHLGRLPDSPDIFAWSAKTYHRFDKATRDISAKADREDVNLAEATVSYLLGPGGDIAAARD